MPPMTDRHLEVADKLEQIRTEMIRLDMWSTRVPDATALESNQPFCCDTMDFITWLQWVMLPRFRALIEARLPLPESCQIAPMAEMYFLQDNTHNHKPVLQFMHLLQAFDRLVNSNA